jgi:hypothetical protein
MARLRHTVTGVVVNVSDDRTRTLTAAFEPVGDDPPARSSSKAEWVDFAVAHGLDRDEAEDMTKAALIELLG